MVYFDCLVTNIAAVMPSGKVDAINDGISFFAGFHQIGAESGDA